jgi:sugar phosphate isomerase/epimerase
MKSGSTLHRRAFLAAATGVAATAYAPPQVDAGSAAKRNIRFRLGLASYTSRKFSLADTLVMARRVGLSELCLKSFHLPLDAKADSLRAAAAQIAQSGVHLYAGGVISMRNETEMMQAFAYAQQAGMQTIIGVPAPEILPLVQTQVRQTGIRVAIHNHGPGDELYPTPESVYERVRRLDARIGLCVDVGHTTRLGGDPVRALQRCADRVLDVHIKDVTAATPAGHEIEIGRGCLDVPAVLRTLVRIKFSGVVAFEYEKDPEDPLAGLAESVGYVRGVLATL